MTVGYGNLPPLRYYDPRRAFPGYTLFAPMGGYTVWLIDMEGRIVHRWNVDYTPGCHGRLLPNGNLLYGGKKKDSPIADFGGSAGILLEFDWNGDVVWTYEDDYLSHDFYRLDNGNTMLIKWIPMPKEAAKKVKGGVPGTERDGVIWSDVLQEIDRDGKVVWEWIGYEHFDPEIDVICPLCPRKAWGNANACYVMPDGNVLVSYAFMSMIQIVEKKTGSIIWRWGMGHELGFQHNPTVLDNGNILVFDNGRHRQLAPDFSRVIEINPESNGIEWEYTANPPTDFYASHISGAQRLPNGNTLICDGPKGRFFEVTPDYRTVWEYVSPFYNEFGRFGDSNMTFRAYRYGVDYPGLKGTGLDDINMFYAPQTAPSPIPATGPKGGRTYRAPAVGGKNKIGEKEELKKKMQERLGKLGY